MTARMKLPCCAAIFLGLIFAPMARAQGSLVSSNSPATTNAWAVKMEKPGLKNFHRVTQNLFRGAQPTEEGFDQLKTLGIKTVIDLRPFHSDESKLKKTGLNFERFHFYTWHADDDDVVRFLKIVTNTNCGPCFVHCAYGSDRTGMMVAAYRVAVEGWTKDDAIAEMTQGDFGFHPQWKNLVTYVEKLDVASLKKRAGIIAK
jgi:protein tyrosine phosphatase (PTP) superfamily phosphohydrolase (DUF442 family)